MIIGIGGLSRAGKTTLAKNLQAYYQKKDYRVRVLHQDEFAIPPEKIPRIRGRVDWEHPRSIDFERFRQTIEDAASNHDLVIAEGLFAFADPQLDGLYDKRIVVEIDKTTFLKRKSTDRRWGKEPDWYVEHIWNSYRKYGQPVNSSEVLWLNAENPFDLPAVCAFLKDQLNRRE